MLNLHLLQFLLALFFKALSAKSVKDYSSSKFKASPCGYSIRTDQDMGLRLTGGQAITLGYE